MMTPRTWLSPRRVTAVRSRVPQLGVRIAHRTAGSKGRPAGCLFGRKNSFVRAGCGHYAGTTGLAIQLPHRLSTMDGDRDLRLVLLALRDGLIDPALLARAGEEWS